MKLIVGLGNPGRLYTRNRHNVGFDCVSYIARKGGIQLDKKQARARIGSGNIAGNKVVIARPQTYMNASGESVSRLVNKFKVKPADLFVIHDDMDLPLGKVRIRDGSSSGGHKGINSIIKCLGRRDFIRIRIGIGRPSSKEKDTSQEDVIDYVLSDFTPEEKQAITQVIPRVSEAVICLLREGLVTAMNRYN
ncbi:aminoacyl-tRNA hydrolase [Chloroflexota bacterium]